MKAATMRVTRQKLGIEPSYSRPRVSDDNPNSEALFRTGKYQPDFPKRSFLTRDDARSREHGSGRWYNEEHRHSGIRLVTPVQRIAVKMRRSWANDSSFIPSPKLVTRDAGRALSGKS